MCVFFITAQDSIAIVAMHYVDTSGDARSAVFRDQCKHARAP